LTAEVLDATSSVPLVGCNVQFYAVDSGARMLIGEDATDGNGVATITFSYGFGLLAFIAEVSGSQVIATNPIQLVVAKKTVLQLDVSREETDTTHTISGRLLYSGDGVFSRPIKIYLNDVEKFTVYTYHPDGEFSVRLNLEPENNKLTTYNIQAVFEGDEPQDATAYALAPDGQRYPVCTTMQTVYWPSSNTATLTVEPPSTTATADSESTATEQQESTKVEIPPGKTPEEIQQEAEQKGWLKVWHEFSWWYPWYRIHIKININPTIDVGFNPILPGGEKAKWSDLEFFETLLGEVLEETLVQATVLIGMYLLARATSTSFFWISITTEVTKILLQAWFFLADWDNASRMLASGVVSIAMCLFAIVNFYVKPNIFTRFVDALWKICGSARGPLRWMLVTLTEMAEFGKAVGRSWIDAMEAIADFAIAVTALIRYINLTT
jgi:hypothetical protein